VETTVSVLGTCLTGCFGERQCSADDFLCNVLKLQQHLSSSPRGGWLTLLYPGHSWHLCGPYEAEKSYPSLLGTARVQPHVSIGTSDGGSRCALYSALDEPAALAQSFSPHSFQPHLVGGQRHRRPYSHNAVQLGRA
jgi:hypothetical protein